MHIKSKQDPPSAKLFIKEKKIWFPLYYNCTTIDWEDKGLNLNKRMNLYPEKKSQFKVKKMKNNLSLTLTTDDANQEKEINGFALLLGLIFKWKAKPDRKETNKALNRCAVTWLKNTPLVDGFKPISNIQTDEWITKYPNRWMDSELNRVEIWLAF